MCPFIKFLIFDVFISEELSLPLNFKTFTYESFNLWGTHLSPFLNFANQFKMMWNVCRRVLHNLTFLLGFFKLLLIKLHCRQVSGLLPSSSFVKFIPIFELCIRTSNSTFSFQNADLIFGTTAAALCLLFHSYKNSSLKICRIYPTIKTKLPNHNIFIWNTSDEDKILALKCCIIYSIKR